MFAGRSWGLGTGQSDKQRAHFEGQLGVLAKALKEHGGPYLTGPDITLVRGLVGRQGSLSRPALLTTCDRLAYQESKIQAACRQIWQYSLLWTALRCWLQSMLATMCALHGMGPSVHG